MQVGPKHIVALPGGQRKSRINEHASALLKQQKQREKNEKGAGIMLDRSFVLWQARGQEVE